MSWWADDAHALFEVGFVNPGAEGAPNRIVRSQLANENPNAETPAALGVDP